MKPIAEYELIDRAYPFRLRGNDNQQNNTGVLYRPPTAQVATGAREGALTGAPGGSVGESLLTGIGLGGFSLHNRSGGAIAMGIGVRIPNILWRAGQWIDANTAPFTDDTTDAQDTDSADDFALETKVNNDGFVVHSSVLFNAISINVTTSDVGGSPVRAIRYSNAAGDGWLNFANLFLQDASAAAYSTGEQLVVFSPPTDWGRTQAGGLSGIPASRYAVNVRATTAPVTSGATAASLSIYRLFWLTASVANNGTLEVLPGSMELVMVPGDALVAFFGTANNQNRVSALVRPRV